MIFTADLQKQTEYNKFITKIVLKVTVPLFIISYIFVTAFLLLKIKSGQSYRLVSVVVFLTAYAAIVSIILFFYLRSAYDDFSFTSIHVNSNSFTIKIENLINEIYYADIKKIQISTDCFKIYTKDFHCYIVPYLCFCNSSTLIEEFAAIKAQLGTYEQQYSRKRINKKLLIFGLIIIIIQIFNYLRHTK